MAWTQGCPEPCQVKQWLIALSKRRLSPSIKHQIPTKISDLSPRPLAPNSSGHTQHSANWGPLPPLIKMLLISTQLLRHNQRNEYARTSVLIKRARKFSWKTTQLKVSPLINFHWPLNSSSINCLNEFTTATASATFSLLMFWWVISQTLWDSSTCSLLTDRQLIKCGKAIHHHAQEHWAMFSVLSTGYN